MLTSRGDCLAIGVNDDAQIKNIGIRNNNQVKKVFIKPSYLDIIRDDNVNINQPRELALKDIEISTVICAFGVSVGDTDKYWWEHIGNWLKKSNGILLIFDYYDGGKSIGSGRKEFINRTDFLENKRNEVIERFLRLAEMDLNWTTDNPKRIVVDFDTKMFDFKLPYIKEASFLTDEQISE